MQKTKCSELPNGITPLESFESKQRFGKNASVVCTPDRYYLIQHERGQVEVLDGTLQSLYKWPAPAGAFRLAVIGSSRLVVILAGLRMASPEVLVYTETGELLHSWEGPPGPPDWNFYLPDVSVDAGTGEITVRMFDVEGEDYTIMTYVYR
jgi:hypothetical protein